MSVVRDPQEEGMHLASLWSDTAERGYGLHSGRDANPASDHQRERWQLGETVSKQDRHLPAARCSGDLDANRRALAVQLPEQARDLAQLQQQIASPPQSGEATSPRSNLPETEGLKAVRATSVGTSFSSNRIATEVHSVGLECLSTCSHSHQCAWLHMQLASIKSGCSGLIPSLLRCNLIHSKAYKGNRRKYHWKTVEV